MHKAQERDVITEIEDLFPDIAITQFPAWKGSTERDQKRRTTQFILSQKQRKRTIRVIVMRSHEELRASRLTAYYQVRAINKALSDKVFAARFPSRAGAILLAVILTAASCPDNGDPLPPDLVPGAHAADEVPLCSLVELKPGSYPPMINGSETLNGCLILKGLEPGWQVEIRSYQRHRGVPGKDEVGAAHEDDHV